MRRRSVADRRVTRLVGQFLKAGVLAEDQFLRTDDGTPQGGIISPLLANIVLSAIEERYERWTCQRQTHGGHQKDGMGPRGVHALMIAQPVPVRSYLCATRMTLWFWSQVRRRMPSRKRPRWQKTFAGRPGSSCRRKKTKVTSMTDGFEFLGFRFGTHWDKRYGFGPRIQIPKAKASDLRRKVKRLTGRGTSSSLGNKLQEIIPILRGWANYYRHCAYAGRVFTSLEWFIGKRIWRWLRKKRPKASERDLWAACQPSSRRTTRRLWREGSIEQHLLAWTPVCRFRLAWMGKPDLRHVFRRAGCVTKDACPVRREAVRNQP